MGRQKGYLSAVKAIYLHEGGFLGFYRGVVPVFFSFSISASITFAMFDSFYIRWE